MLVLGLGAICAACVALGALLARCTSSRLSRLPSYRQAAQTGMCVCVCECLFKLCVLILVYIQNWLNPSCHIMGSNCIYNVLNHIRSLLPHTCWKCISSGTEEVQLTETKNELSVADWRQHQYCAVVWWRVGAGGADGGRQENRSRSARQCSLIGFVNMTETIPGRLCTYLVRASALSVLDYKDDTDGWFATHNTHGSSDA